MTPQKAISLLIHVMSRQSFNYVDEKQCQVEMDQFFDGLGLTYEREHIFGKGTGTCDFFFPQSGIVVEAKAFKSWSKRQVYRQCERYCKRPEVKGLILATGKAQGLPQTINGKPVQVYQLGLGSL